MGMAGNAAGSRPAGTLRSLPLLLHDDAPAFVSFATQHSGDRDRYACGPDHLRLRHQLVASGCRLAPNRDAASVVVEARAGAIGTDRNDVLVGLPSTSVSVMGNGTSIPEIALFKRTDQRGVAKVNLFAYERASGRPVWQSGLARVNTATRDRWVAGAGPFQDGDIHDRIEFAGERFWVPWRRKQAVEEERIEAEIDALAERTDLRHEKIFTTLPPAGSPAAERTMTADERPVDLPAIR